MPYGSPISPEKEGDPIYMSSIPATYIKHIESAGGRVIPIIFGVDTEETIKEKMSKINGILFPGGTALGDYYVQGKMIWNHAKKLNDEGIFFPLWGTCLGF